MQHFSSRRYGLQLSIPDDWSRPATGPLAQWIGLDRSPLVFRGADMLMSVDVSSAPQGQPPGAVLAALARRSGSTYAEPGAIRAFGADHASVRYGMTASCALTTPVGREMLERTRAAYQDLLNNTNLELLALDLDKVGMCFHVKTYLIVLGATALTIHGALGVDDANDAPEAFAPRETVYDQVVASLRA